jgi:hypothetical protein
VISKAVFKRGFALPPHLAIKKGINFVKRKAMAIRARQHDSKYSTRAKLFLPAHGKLYSYFCDVSIGSLKPYSEQITSLNHHFLQHRFNLLGSGWVQVRHGMACRGLEGYRYEMGSVVQPDREGQWLEDRINASNLAESQRIWSLVGTDYTPIDWHLDFKSGYRWSEDIWYLEIPHGHKPGVDIKVPWELARMQHLPLLASAYALACDKQAGFAAPQAYVREFRNQVFDFIATNPPRFGVNWRSTMDVAIRAANWLVSSDLFKAFGVELDDKFKKEFFQSIYQHGMHIVNNLEWNQTLRGNHYLSNIVGLLFVAAYLPRTPETDAWLAFAVQELVNEVEYQFTLDGANFEASTSYHRLSTEMIIYATALILGLPGQKRAALKNYDCGLLKILPKLKPAPIPFYPLAGSERLTPFPLSYIERLEKMAEFTICITKPNGHIIQIGDNDGGRFLKLQPLYNRMTVTEAKARYANLYNYTDFSENDIYLDEDHLDHRHMVAAINGLFRREDFSRFTGNEWIETELVQHLAKNTRLPSYRHQGRGAAGRVSINTKEDWNQSNIKLDFLNGPEAEVEKLRGSDPNPCEAFKLCSYPDFGLYIYRFQCIYLAIRCGSIGQNGKGGHAHNDNLSFELNVKGRDFIVDGGSYLYTPLPAIRNDFRSTHAHNTLAVDGYEQNRWRNGLKGLFSMTDDAQAHLLVFNEKYLRGEHNGFGRKHFREFKWQDRFLLIEDAFDATLSSEINFNLSPCLEVAQLRETGPEEYYLELLNDGVPLGIYLTGFNSVETADGFYSLGYGKRVKNQRVRCHRSGQSSLIKINTGSENYQG